MKTRMIKLFVLVVVCSSSLVTSGCEGLNPAADFMKIQAEEMQSRRETEAELQMQENELAAQIKLKEMEYANERQKAADAAAAETRKAQADADPASQEVITPGTDVEGTANVDSDEGGVDNSVSNEETNENLGD